MVFLYSALSARPDSFPLSLSFSSHRITHVAEHGLKDGYTTHLNICCMTHTTSTLPSAHVRLLSSFALFLFPPAEHTAAEHRLKDSYTTRLNICLYDSHIPRLPLRSVSSLYLYVCVGGLTFSALQYSTSSSFVFSFRSFVS